MYRKSGFNRIDYKKKEEEKVAVIRPILFAIIIAVAFGACTTEPPLLGYGNYPHDPALVSRVQIALRDRGYYSGNIDGFLGQETANAIELFQVEHCLRAKPVIDRPLLLWLRLRRYE
ncbi:MAG TPA: peptidoglycan-binding protein [Chthoniobacterales bacterium]|nr:peptidoglycan-binding protein [Chthoniobacterales bacterium]